MGEDRLANRDPFQNKHTGLSNNVYASAVDEIAAAITAALPYLQPVDSLVIGHTALLEAWAMKWERNLVKKMRPGSTKPANYDTYLKTLSMLLKMYSLLGISPSVRASLMANLSSSQRDQAAANAAEDLRARHARPITAPRPQS